ncbi:PTS sugar transporter subunit IIB [Spiroplasma culicicola]|uniref:PTS system cellobiose-specific IIB component n=1 Tax=Spiroplasma culicicola AES-1 TaxID=1276246 RepID=W6A6U0_9MOLU|nr:PTS sugar transporter subunit IIB [Spiroplasma culicicola]AHI52595.1 PTS system cellobiose-specific IIB component [Spiroplasma culicicola AES-1]
MKKVLLACAGGMSTSILVGKMRDIAFEDEIDVTIDATSVANAKTMANDWDIVLLGPQVSFELDGVKEVTSTPVFVINADDYGKANGQKVLDFALSNCK